MITAKLQDQHKMHGALISANVFFGVGAVVGALGLPATHPLAFALVREFWAGLILLAVSYYLYEYDQDAAVEDNNAKTADPLTKRNSLRGGSGMPSSPLWGWRPQWRAFAVLGLVVFGNQAGFIVGIKMAGPVTASVWQPSQPIFTAAICMALGWEPIQQKRLAGVLVASLGCVVMVLLKNTTAKPTALAEDDAAAAASATNHYLIGNALFFGNCLCTSLYVILSKRMLRVYPALCVTAWSYNFAVLYMLAATLLANALPGSKRFFCPECPGDEGFWHLPGGAIPALLYYIVFASVGSYGLITWANQHATGTLVMSYTVLQPVTSALLTSALLVVGLVAGCAAAKDQDEACLDFPSLGTFCGMLGVFGGLYLIISTEPKRGGEANSNGEDDDLLETIPLNKVPSDAQMQA